MFVPNLILLQQMKVIQEMKHLMSDLSVMNTGDLEPDMPGPSASVWSVTAWGPCTTVLHPQGRQQ